MCGIAAILQLDRHPVDVSHLHAMCSTIAYRGPDGAGFARLSGGHVALASVRLSIRDIPGGAQPLFNEDRTVVVVCNGELYDYDEHRKALQRKGHVLRTGSDSELLVHLYEQHGLKFISLLNGEFAFVLWDENRQLMVAARDRIGVKPLYYYMSARKLLLSSEVKGIFSVPEVPRRLSLDYFMGAGMGVVPENATAFDEVHSLRPGHYLIAQGDRVLDEQPFHEWSFAVDSSMVFEEAVSRVRESVTKSVKRRLKADVSVHCYLSGGVDSAIICGLMAENIHTFSAYHVSFPDSAFDESADAEDVSRHFGQTMRVVRCTNGILLDNLVKTVEHVEMPLVNCNAVGKFLLSKLVRSDGNKVCLTGEGADEAFGGYPYFKLEALWQSALQQQISGRQYRTLWTQFQKLEKRSLNLVWHRTGAWRDQRNPYGYPNYLHLRAVDFGLIMPFLFVADVSRDALEQRFLKEFPPEAFAGLHPFNTTRRLAFSSLAGGIIPPLGDRVEMAHSIECRTPFLDVELLRLTAEIPPRHFMDLNTLREKRILYEAFRHLLPQSVQRRHKHPFLAPQWRSILTTPAGLEFVQEFLSPEHVRRVGIYCPRAVATIKSLWQLCPAKWSVVRRLDSLIGIMLTTHILYDRLIENRIEQRADLTLANLSPAQHSDSARSTTYPVRTRG